MPAIRLSAEVHYLHPSFCAWGIRMRMVERALIVVAMMAIVFGCGCMIGYGMALEEIQLLLRRIEMLEDMVRILEKMLAWKGGIPI